MELEGEEKGGLEKSASKSELVLGFVGAAGFAALGRVMEMDYLPLIPYTGFIFARKGFRKEDLSYNIAV